MLSLTQLEQRFPWVAWRTPVKMTMRHRTPYEQSGYVCRICIAQIGLGGTDVHRLKSYSQTRRHILKAHVEEEAHEEGR